MSSFQFSFTQSLFFFRYPPTDRYYSARARGASFPVRARFAPPSSWLTSRSSIMGGEKRVNHGDERTRARALGVHPARQVVLVSSPFFFPVSLVRNPKWGHNGECEILATAFCSDAIFSQSICRERAVSLRLPLIPSSRPSHFFSIRFSVVRISLFVFVLPFHRRYTSFSMVSHFHCCPFLSDLASNILMPITVTRNNVTNRRVSSALTRREDTIESKCINSYSLYSVIFIVHNRRHW